jgi:aminoglycoside 6'-N-acetyltransferase
VDVSLRPLEDGDFPRLAAIVAEDEVARWWGPNDEASLRADAAPDQVTGFAILVGGELAGYLTVNEERDPNYGYAEPDLFVSSEHHGSGAGAQALRLALRWAFEERGHTRAIIQPRADNARAIRCYEKVGFRPVGILREADRGRDALAMDLLKDELS